MLERLPGISEIPKGNGLVGQIVQVLDYGGLLDRLRAEATWAGPVPRFSFGPLQLDFSRLGTSPLHILSVPQRRLERLLEQRLAELGGTVRRGHELTALSQDDDAVTLDALGPDGAYQLRARYLVGCDGAHSLVRKQAGVGFPGVTSTEISRIGQVRLPTAKLARFGGGSVKVPGLGRLKLAGQVRTPRGTYSLAPLARLNKNAPAGVYIVYTSEDDPTVDLSAPMTQDEREPAPGGCSAATCHDLPAATEPARREQPAGRPLPVRPRPARRRRRARLRVVAERRQLDADNLGWKLAAQARAGYRAACWSPTTPNGTSPGSTASGAPAPRAP